MIKRVLLPCLLLMASVPALAQRPELREHDLVRDSVNAALHRELADGLWANAIAAGDLKGNIVMDMVVEEKGRVETVFTSSYTVPVGWKNIIQDQWINHRFGFKLPKGRKEKVTIELNFP